MVVSNQIFIAIKDQYKEGGGNSYILPHILKPNLDQRIIGPSKLIFVFTKHANSFLLFSNEVGTASLFSLVSLVVCCLFLFFSFLL